MDFAVREVVYAPGMRQARHAHDHSNVTIVAAGELEEAADGGVYRAIASSVVLKSAHTEHEDRISGVGARTLAVEFGRETAFGRMLAPGVCVWFDNADVVRRALMLQRAFAAADVRAIGAHAAALVEAVLSRHAKPSVAPEWIAKFRSILDERFDQPIRFDALARDFGLHPVYASRAFRRFVGVSMTDYLQAARLRDARRQLASSARTIAGIATLSGFADASHLCRTFSSRLGVTPTEYRRMTRFSAFNAPASARFTLRS